MRLVTFQSLEAFKDLKRKGVLKVPASFSNANSKKYDVPYHFIMTEMKKKLPDSDAIYPLWAWEKCGGFIAPRKRKNILNIRKPAKVKITFSKPDKEVFLSDYMAYSFILSGHIVPKNKAEYALFLKAIVNLGIDLKELKAFVRKEKTSLKVKQLFPEIKKTWFRIFNLKSNVHQACIWDIKLEEVEKVELCDDPQFLYNSMNPLRPDGTRPDWKKEYLKFIP